MIITDANNDSIKNIVGIKNNHNIDDDAQNHIFRGEKDGKLSVKGFHHEFDISKDKMIIAKAGRTIKTKLTNIYIQENKIGIYEAKVYRISTNCIKNGHEGVSTFFDSRLTRDKVLYLIYNSSFNKIEESLYLTSGKYSGLFVAIYDDKKITTAFPVIK
jgi:hypothetical protein